MHARLLILLVVAVTAVIAQSCPTFSTLTSVTGTIAVGQPGTQYTDSTSCLWLIDLSKASPPVTSVTVTFTRLDTEFYYDFVAFFNGNFTGTAFKAVSGQPDTPPESFSSPGNVVGVWFNADEALSFSGFSLNYVGAQCSSNCNGPTHGFCQGTTCQCNEGYTGDQCETQTCGANSNCGGVGTCSGTTCTCPDDTYGPVCTSKQCQMNKVLTGQTGTFFDHIGTGNYEPDRSCSWLINPTPAVQSIRLRFDSFSTELDYDYVLVYSGSDANGILLGNFSGSLTNAPEIVSIGPSMYVTFNSDQYVESAGFQLSWEGVNCDAACAANGRCFGGTCLCNLGWTGAACDQPICSNNCSGHGTCTANVCACDAGWTAQADCARCTDASCLSNVAYCSNVQNLNGAEGVIRDNNGTASKAGAYCTFFITALDANNNKYDGMTLEWEFFDLDPQEASVVVYDTATSARPQGIYTGSVVPPPVHSPGNTMLVVFATATAPVQPLRGGFVASWKGYNCPSSCNGRGQCVAGVCECNEGWTGAACDQQTCTGTPVCSAHGQCVATAAGQGCACSPGFFGPDCSSSFCEGETAVQLDATTSSVTLQDHSGGNFYRAFSDCGWRVTATGPITIAFSEFQLLTQCPFGSASVTTQCTDYVVVYDGPSTNSSILGIFGGYGAPLPRVSTGNSVYIKFITNSQQEGNGFTASLTLNSACSSCANGFCVAGKCVCQEGFGLSSGGSGCIPGAQAALPLTLDVPRNGTAEPFVWNYFRYTPSRNSGGLVFTLYTPEAAVPDSVWLLVRTDAVPDSSTFSYANTVGSPVRNIRTPGVGGTTYYVAVVGTWTPPNAYSIVVSESSGTPRGGGGGGSGSRTGAIIGAIIISLIIVTVAALIIYYVWKKRAAGAGAGAGASSSPAPDNSPPPRADVDMKQFRNNNPDA